jgi:hypothetical protein
MKSNEANWDRLIRLALGLLFLYLGWAVMQPRLGIWSLLMLGMGAVLVLTGLLGVCLLYAYFDIDTRQ